MTFRAALLFASLAACANQPQPHLGLGIGLGPHGLRLSPRVSTQIGGATVGTNGTGASLGTHLGGVSLGVGL